MYIEYFIIYRYNQAAVWLQFAECLFGAGNLELAEQAFTRVNIMHTQIFIF